MKITNGFIALALLGLTLPLPAVEAQEKPGRQQRRQEDYEQQLQQMKDMMAFFADIKNLPTLSTEDVLAYGRLNAGGTGKRQRPGALAPKGMSPRELCGGIVLIALEVYSRKHPGDYSKLKQLLHRGVPLTPSGERTMNQLSDRDKELLKPHFTPPGSGGINPRARQAVPKPAFDATWKSFGEVVSLCNNEVIEGVFK